MQIAAPRGLIICLVIGVIALGCNRQQAEAPKIPPPKVAVVAPVRRSVTTYHSFTGQTDAVESAEVRARVRGFLSRVAFQEGTEVERGTVLYEIDPREYQATLARAEADVLRANAVLGLAQAEEQRAATLRRTNAVTEEEFQQRVATRLQAEAAIKQSQAAVDIAKLELSYTSIVAPISGRVGRTLITVGNLVGYNEPTLLTTIVRLDPIYVFFDSPERQFLEYQTLIREQGAASAEQRRVPVFVGFETDEGYPHEGVIDFRENRIDPNTGTVTVRAVLPNPQRTITPGMFARIRVPIGQPRDQILVPQEAIAFDQRGSYVLVVGEGNTVEYRSVTTGQREGDLIVVSKGLDDGERIVASGTQKARPGGQIVPAESNLQTAAAEPVAPRLAQGNRTSANSAPAMNRSPGATPTSARTAATAADPGHGRER